MGPLFFVGPVFEPGASSLEWVYLPGLSLEQLEALAILSAFSRHSGNRRQMMTELGISKSGLLRHLDALGLRTARAEPEEL
jgi:DNA-binding NtrC family response regulator